MNKQNKQNKNKLIGLKVFFASLSITSLLGIFNYLLNKNSSVKNNSDTAQPQKSDLGTLLNSPLPTLATASKSLSNPETVGLRQAEPIPAQELVEKPKPVIENLTVNSGGSSGSRSAPSTTTSSSR